MMPLVACMMLTKDRPAMRERARRCFLAQTYPSDRRILVTLDNTGRPRVSFGILRNEGATLCELSKPDIIIHWDDDDWHSPDRIERQVAQLQASEKGCVGLSSGLFYERETGECWQYKSTEKHYAFGASLCYWTETWRKKPFPVEKWNGAEETWAEIVGREGMFWQREVITRVGPPEPFMICEVHGQNHGTQIKKQAESDQWIRMPEWDGWCAERLQLQYARFSPRASAQSGA